MNAHQTTIDKTTNGQTNNSNDIAKIRKSAAQVLDIESSMGVACILGAVITVINMFGGYDLPLLAILEIIFLSGMLVYGLYFVTIKFFGSTTVGEHKISIMSDDEVRKFYNDRLQQGQKGNQRQSKSTRAA